MIVANEKQLIWQLLVGWSVREKNKEVGEEMNVSSFF